MKVIKGFSKKIDGSMKVISGPSQEKNIINRKSFLEKIGFCDTDLVLVSIVHGNKVVVVTETNKGKIIPDYDGMVTNIPNIILGVTAADCLPIYFWNKEKTVVGIAHAGWKGVQSKIVQTIVEIFIKQYGCLATDIYVEVGPHIRVCHFEVKEDVVEKFSDYSDCLKEINKVNFLNLGRIVEKQLISLGILPNNVKISSECTFCEQEKYFSYRRDKPEEIEAMLAYIMIKNR